MAYFEFPHTREYEGDLGFIIKKIIELSENYEQFFRYNTIHFADPIEWSITSQYAAFTIVFDTDNGSSYISKQPVPAGITLDNSDFWSFVGPLIVDGAARTEIERILHFIVNIYEANNTATAVRHAGDFAIIQGELYRVTTTINVGETYTPGVNVVKTTIENMIPYLVPVDSVLNTQSFNAVANAPVSLKFAQVDNEIVGLHENINATNSELINANNNISALEENLTTETAERQAADGVINQRIDSIVQLTPGSTTGDAELIDGRIAYNGEVFPSIGDSIRNQVQRAIGFNNSADLRIFEPKFMKCDISMIHAGANIKWAIYCTKSLLRLKFTPRFVTDDSSTEVTTGTYTWYRYKATGITDGAAVSLISSGTRNVGESLQFDNVYSSEVICIVSSYNAYTYKSCDLFGMCYVDNTNHLTGVTNFAGNQIVGDYEYTEYENPEQSKYDTVSNTELNAGAGHTYYNWSSNTAGTNVLWGLYTSTTRKFLRFTPEFNFSGTYKYVVYKTTDGSNVAHDSLLTKVYEGTKNTGEYLYFPILTPDMFVEINPSTPGGVDAIKFTNNRRYDILNLGYVSKVSISSKLYYQVKSPVSFAPYSLSGKIEIIEPKHEVKTWGAFGDSLTEYNFRAAHNYVDYVAEDLGLVVKNYGVSGSGYKNSNWDNKAYYQRILNVNPNDFDIFTIMGSINDSSNYTIADIGDVTDSGTTTICGCINTTLANFFSVAPYTPIGIITATPSAAQNASDPDCFMSKYTEKLIEIAKLHAIPVLDLYHNNGLRPQDPAFLTQFYTSDVTSELDTNGIHPNSEGHKKYIAPKVREFIRSLMY